MITLTTDFGLKDPYVAEMKGVILSINPKATVIDVSHGIEKFNVQMGAFTLASATAYFPKDTVHVAVVDPGVGTQRRAIVIQTKRAFFVGPDNGVLMLAAQSQGVEHIYELSNPNLRLSNASNTFHGRDIFAPAAAYLDRGAKPRDFGAEIKNPMTPTFSAVEISAGALTSEVLYVDDFGNIVTNIKEKNTINAESLTLKLPQLSVKAKFCRVYGEAEPSETVVLVGSHGFVEVAVNQGSAAERFHVRVGDRIVFTAA